MLYEVITRKGYGFVLAALILAGCEPSVPDSAAGVGFGDYETYLHAREAELRGQQAAATAAAKPAAPIVPPDTTGATYGAAGYGATPVTSSAGMAAQTGGSSELGAETMAALHATEPSYNFV